MLTPAVRRTIAPKPLQVDGTRHPATLNVRRIAGLVRALENLEALATKGEHLGHEWKSFQLPLCVQGSQDFVLCSNLDPVTGFQLGTI